MNIAWFASLGIIYELRIYESSYTTEKKTGGACHRSKVYLFIIITYDSEKGKLILYFSEIFLNLGLVAIVGRVIEGHSLHAIGQILLLYIVVWIIVGV